MISPIDIRQHTFKRGLRGYNEDEVRTFLNSLASEWQKVLEENGQLKHQLEKAEASIQQYKQVEAMLHRTLEQAEKSSADTLENAKREAHNMVQEAENRAAELLQEAAKERSRIEQEIHGLVSRRNDMLVQLRSFLQAQTERLSEFKEHEAVRLERVEVPKVAAAKAAPAPAPVQAAPVVDRQPKAAQPTPTAPVEQPAPTPTTANPLLKQRTSFFDQALQNSSASAVDDLLDGID
jgi:cell division initiation protein